MKELYNDLMALTAKPGNMFFHRDTLMASGETARIFSYHYASYSEWLEPSALECRGIMFALENGEPTRIMARPMEKFFNVNECPFTMNLDFSKATHVMTKEDGSLVSSFIDKRGYLYMKSKASISSPQAIESMQVLSLVKNEALMYRVLELAHDGFTCNFEYVAPHNRIVLPYDKAALILLNVRHNNSGDYVPYDELLRDPVLSKVLVQNFVVDFKEDWIDEIRALDKIEGFVIDLGNQRVKLKTKWYTALHHTKNSINSSKDLFNVVVSGASDDIKGMFDGDVEAIKKIKSFENAYLIWLSDSLKRIQDLYDELRGRDRKYFAVTSQNSLKQTDQYYLFNDLMGMYQGRIDLDLIIKSLGEVFMKYHKQFIPIEYLKETIIFED
ncbi:RNA ligase, phage-associated |uniref:RNA ligase 1 n=1 Tax=Yersinia phage phiR1-RT TaxID=1206558 RepID=I7J405_BPPR1|nr:RNA ligase and tail fiber protein attachment catalyst [Yersinia phage phiR1-RT]CCI88803.1 RNA ligase, phage-associated \